MSILPHHEYPLNPLNHVRSCQFYTGVVCSAKTTKPISNPKRLMVEPLLVSPPPLVVPTRARPPVLNDPSLQSTWSHRAWVASGCTTMFISLAKSIWVAADSQILVESILSGLVGYIFADLGSGVYHWGIDNYGDESTPIFGAQIEAFQGHHKWPWTITRRQFANNIHALARAVTFFVLPIDIACNDPVILGFVGVCSGCIMFSQQFHSWAHGTKSKLPPLVVALQDLGVLVSRSEHGMHHRPPYNNNYCIVSGVWNEFLDEKKMFELLEMVLFFKLGVRPRSWCEPGLEWTEETETQSQVG